ncbi:Xaa-Pro aminopeptidase [Rhizobium leguminosarum bv. trifolii WSM597]|uniref:Xaa-Pro aminopeptidase n=1 Tax=Rhizobium leguminosarum bv. trifolii WSM597 TaxID=754764 RepID=I9NK60_RHILT|nr:Xaa-Pro aminopeptidase [Rhizobium leguminosarum bv. trifolii WSM597]
MSSDSTRVQSKSDSSFPITLSTRRYSSSPTIPSAELEVRIRRLRAEMSKASIDIIVLTDSNNIQYFTGFRTLSMLNKTRPNMALLTQERVIFVGSRSEGKYRDDLGPSFSGVQYSGYLAEAVDLLTDQINGMPAAIGRRVAIDYGQDMLGHGSLQLIDRIKGLSYDQSIKSAVNVLWRVRMIKTPFEVEMKKIGFDIINKAFDQAIAHAYVGMSELELYQIMQAQIYLNGAESSEPMPLLFSDGDFYYSRWPSDRKLREGHYVWSDFYATYGGYPTDRNRIARCGDPAQWEVDTYRSVRALTIELAKSIKPGLRCCDVFSQFQRLWGDAGLGAVYGLVSRIGHGGGMDILEPPSLSASDDTIIEAGMVFHLEPKLEKNGAVFQFEEVVHVLDHDVEFISELSPEQLPIIRP